MIEEQAVVVQVQGDRAQIEIERSKPCGLCGPGGGCGLSLWGRLLNRKQAAFTLDNSLQLRVGERVVVSLDESALLGMVFSTYLVPMLLVFIGAFSGNALGESRAASDLFAVLGAVAGLACGLYLVRLAGAQMQQPTVLRRAESSFVRQCSKVNS